MSKSAHDRKHTRPEQSAIRGAAYQRKSADPFPYSGPYTLEQIGHHPATTENENRITHEKERHHMAGIVGYNGSFRVAANIVGDISEYSLDIERNTEEDSAFGDSWEEPVNLQGKWSGSAKGRWNIGDTQQGALQTAVLNGTTAALRLYTDSDSYYAGTAVITKLSVGAAVNGLVNVEFSFTGSGAITYT